MPQRAKRACRTPGCPGLAEQGYCPACLAKRPTQRKPDKRTDRVNGYATPAWQKLRAAKLEMTPYCERCLKKKIHVHAKIVHHLDAVGDGHPLLCSLGRLESLCRACHERERTATRRRWG